MSRDIAVIGAGLGGLSAAIHLAAQGHSVQIFEKSSAAGGKMRELTRDGFRFDTGPSLLTMPTVIDSLFSAAGENRPDYLTFLPVDPVCRYFWNDGTALDTHQDPERMQQAIAAISRRDARAYSRWFDYTRKIYDLAGEVFLQTPIHELKQLATVKNLRRLVHIFDIDPLRTVHGSVTSFFKHPKIAQLFDRFTTYNGSNPYRAPATLNIIPYVEHGLGAFYIQGGMYRLVDALLKLCTKLGVRIHLNTAVDRIEQQDNRVTGIRTDGDSLPFDMVVCNADVVEANRTLIVDNDRRNRKLARLEPSLSGMVFMWGVEGRYPQLSHHNIFFSENYQQEFQQIFDKQQAPADPTVYLAITSKRDKRHAPDGCENWFILLNMPYLTENQDWQKNIAFMRSAIHDKLLAQGINVRQSIRTETVWTPEDFYRRFGSNRGSIYGLSSNSKFAAFRRPANRSRDVDGLYFAGGSVHPGGGIPLVLLSGKMVADLIGGNPADRSNAFEQPIADEN